MNEQIFVGENKELDVGGQRVKKFMYKRSEHNNISTTAYPPGQTWALHQRRAIQERNQTSPIYTFLGAQLLCT
jgi:hypothetical protein